ncbi:unnamed protein product [Discula destructiva]
MEPKPEAASQDVDTLVAAECRWEDNDGRNPVNFSKARKIFIVFVGLLAIFNSTFDSSLTSGTIDDIAASFGVTSDVQLVLPVSVYLLGYVVGPLFWSPASEVWGRRPVLLGSFSLFLVFTAACALAPSWSAFLLFRWLCGTFASSALTVVGGMYADIYDDPMQRGRAMALFLAFTAIGPQPAPAVSGFVSTALGWRWVFWVGLIFAAICFVPVLFLPETFSPALLRADTRKAQRSSPGLEHGVNTAALVRKSLLRPLRMLVSEPLCIAMCLFVSYASAIFFIYFESYPIIFQDLYGLSTGVAGLTFLPIAVGALCGFAITLWYDTILARAKARDARWAQIEEYRRLPLGILGGIAYVVSLLWLGWSARPEIHWAVPMMSGIVFGIGFMLIFSASLNYLTDAYTIYAASALATASFTRSLLGAFLPLAAPKLFGSLGVAWGNSLLALLSLLLTLLPVLFIKLGPELRRRSRISQEIDLQR